MTNSPSQGLEMKPFANNREEPDDKLTCCTECTSNYEKDVQSFKSAGHKKLLPPWVQPQSHGSNDADQKVPK